MIVSMTSCMMELPTIVNINSTVLLNSLIVDAMCKETVPFQDREVQHYYPAWKEFNWFSGQKKKHKIFSLQQKTKYSVVVKSK